MQPPPRVGKGTVGSLLGKGDKESTFGDSDAAPS